MTFTNSYKLHLLVGLGVGVWLVLFLVFIAPFDVSDLSFIIRIKITYIYGIIFFACYAVGMLFQGFLFKRYKSWSIRSEITLYLFLYLIALPFIMLYYYSGIVNGDYTPSRFITEQYIPILVIITPIMFLLRKFIASNEQVKQLIELKDGVVTLKGDNKKDVLRLNPNAIVTVQSSDNYVEVSYLDKDELKKKLLRTTLKNVESQFNFLVRAHRSYLINLYHFKEWKEKEVIVVNQMEVPVAKQYRKKILEVIRP